MGSSRGFKFTRAAPSALAFKLIYLRTSASGVPLVVVCTRDTKSFTSKDLDLATLNNIQRHHEYAHVFQMLICYIPTIDATRIDPLDTDSMFSSEPEAIPT